MSTSQERGGSIPVFLPITLKGIAWLRRKYVETALIARHDLWELFSSIQNADTSTKDLVSGATSFIEFVAIVQSHEILDKKVKELSKHYWYSTSKDKYKVRLTVGKVKKFVAVPSESGDDWTVIGWKLPNKEAEGVIRLVEFDGEDGDKVLDDDLVLHKITI